MNEIKGLTWKEATKALRLHGHNEVSIKQKSLFLLLVSQVKSPLIGLLLLASIISLLLGNIIDALIILLIVSINTLIGFVQEYRAKNTFKNLEKLVRSHVWVLRDGHKVLIDKSTVVPGDIIYIKKGDIICADAFVLEQDNLSVDESAITGESQEVHKHINLKHHRGQKSGIVYSGTYVNNGSCTAKVFATGKDSKWGQIAYLTESTVKVSEYEKNLEKLSKVFMVVSVIAILIIFAINVFVKHELGVTNLLLFTIAISVAIIPEALPIVANLTLSKSALKLSNQKVIVKHNSAIEDLGNIDVICTDKTGTLTLNKLTIDFFHSVIDKDDFLKYSYLSTVENTELLDRCIFTFLKENNVADHSEFMLQEIPFDPEKKFSARKFKDFEIIKGAPEYIFGITKNDKPEERKLIEEHSQKGLRAISFALKKGSRVKYIGSYFFSDQIKEDADKVIQEARNLGITIKIITGDSKEVSAYVAQKVGLIKTFDEVVLAEELDFNNADKLVEQITKHSVFTRCNPEQKYKIIECLQNNHYVGYLGDGINDAPSLALANVGIAVDTATDIAKEQSDIILLSGDLKVIINGIKEGRLAFENIDKYLRNSLAGNFGGFFTIGVLSAFIKFLPMLPIQIFISNLLTDIPLLSIASDNVDFEVLKSPKHHSMAKTLKFALIFGLISSLFDFIFFYLVRNQLPHSIQTQWFLLSVLTELIILFSLRTRKSLLSKTSWPSRLLIQLSALSFIVALALALFGLPGTFESIGLPSIAFVLLVGLVYFDFTEAIKVPIIRFFKL